MYRIEKKEYGFLLVFEGFISKDEIQNWYQEVSKYLEVINEEFLVFVDMRKLIPLLPDAQQIMQNGQLLFKNKGMARSVVIVKDKITKMQFIRIAKQTGIYKWERYIDVSNNYNWQQVAFKWLNEAIDPENEPIEK